MKIEEVALTFGFDIDSLENKLSWIKDRHEKRQEGYKSYLNETEVNALLNGTGRRAQNLAHYLTSLPIDVKEALNGVCLFANPTVKGRDSDPSSNFEDFINDTIGRLNKIERATSTLNITFDQKKMGYKDLLVLDLRVSWEDLGGSRPSKSSKKNLFIDYLLQACEFMDIDSTGLPRRHLNLD